MRGERQKAALFLNLKLFALIGASCKNGDGVSISGFGSFKVSDMENGHRPISLKMAKRIGEEFKIPHKGFV